MEEALDIYFELQKTRTAIQRKLTMGTLYKAFFRVFLEEMLKKFCFAESPQKVAHLRVKMISLCMVYVRIVQQLLAERSSTGLLGREQVSGGGGSNVTKMSSSSDSLRHFASSP